MIRDAHAGDGSRRLAASTRVLAARPGAAAGFSILEALISMTMFLLVLTAVLTIYEPARRIHTRGERRIELQQNARLALTQMARQIRMAGYFPENLGGTPPSPPLATPFRVATESAVALYGATDGAGTSTISMFCLDGDVLRRVRGAVASTATYDCDSGEVLAEGVTELRFAYYDANANPLPSPPSAPYSLDGQVPGSVPVMTSIAERSLVQRVIVTLTTQAPVPGGGTDSFTLTSDVWRRNAG